MTSAGRNERRAIDLAGEYVSRERSAVLILIGRSLDAGEIPTISRLAEATGMETAAVRSTVRALEREGDLEVDGDLFRIPEPWETW